MAIAPGIMWGQPLSPPVWHGRELSPAELMAMLREMGLQTIDIFARHAAAYGVGPLRDALDGSGLRCSCYYIQGDLLAEGDERRAVDEAFANGLEAAAALGSPLVFTHGAQHGREGEEALGAYIEVLGERNAQARDAGLTLVIENAGRLVRTPEHLLAVMDALAADGLRLCPDVGNLSIWGIDEVEALRRCLPWTAHVHLKDLHPDYVGNEQARGMPEVLGRGVTPIAEVIGLLHDERWDGAAVWEPGPHDERGIEAGIAELLRLTR